jgi:uncharacterized protein DUF1592/uncharacterized protein DUF1588/uncharacterized protein DUF1587/uncharacterized protein DUF1595/uncharacterized protein DUF1585
MRILIAVFLTAWLLNGQRQGAKDPQFFASEVYPAFQAAGCRGCHSSDGIASTTRLRLPAETAPAEQVSAFGLQLAALVDRQNPRQSLLLVKPTNRVQHTGGERIHPGSAQETALVAWVEYLAEIGQDQVAAANKLVKSYRPAAESRWPIRRLTHSQYNRTVRDLLGVLSQPARRFPPEDYVHGFKNQAAAQAISPALSAAYATAAERLASNAFRYGDSGNLIPCKAEGPGDTACAERFVRQFGRKAFRRPLEESEAQRFKKLFVTEAKRSGNFLEGARIVLEAMLISPAFLFHVQAGKDSKWEQYAVANRLSYFLWDSMPDEELFQMAERRELTTNAGIEKAVRRMLGDPKAQEALQEFFTQWLELDRVVISVKDRGLFPRFSQEVAAAAVEETQRFLADLVWNDRNFLNYLTADYSFINSDLAALYGVPAPPTEFSRVTLPEKLPRSGILGQISFLTLTSQPGETSPTVRGLYVRERLLCQKVPDPPPGVNTNLPPQTEGNLKSTRERLQMHVSNPTCASCHRMIDGIGFGFEHFDAIGRWREKQYVLHYRTGRDRDQRRNAIEANLPIDSQAQVTGIPKSDFSSPKELGVILAGNPECRKCVVRQLFRYAFARPETGADAPMIDQTYERFEASGFRFREMMLALALSDEFRKGN